MSIQIALDGWKKEKEGMEQVEMFSNAIQAMDDGVILTDTENKLTFLNRSASKLTGLENKDVLGKYIDDIFIIIPEGRSGFSLSISLSSPKKERITVPRGVLHVIKDKRKITIHATMKILSNASGHILGSMIVFKEISAERQHEAESSEKDAMLAYTTHELRTPMGAILSASFLLLDGKLTQVQREFVEIISHASRSLLQLINDTLDHGKIDAGKSQLEIVSFELQRVIGDVCNLLKIEADKKGVELVKNFPSSFPLYLKGDPVRIRQILMNLVGNAIKFTHRGQVKIAVSFEPLADQYHNVVIDIEDTGIGIPESRQGKLFTDYVQADTATEQKFGGTGLGLSISRNLARLMDGNIEIKSKEGLGSTFSLKLPMQETNRKYLKKDVGQDKLERNYGKKALLVEDDRMIRKLSRILLQKTGLVVDVAIDGQQGLEMSSLHRYDILFVDIKIPIMDGFTLAKKVRDLPSPYSDIPIVAMTGHASIEYRDKAKRMVINSVLFKPFTFEGLVNELDRWFS